MRRVILAAVVVVLFSTAVFAGYIELRLLKNGDIVKTFCHADFPIGTDTDETSCTGLSSVSCYDGEGKLISECYDDGVYAAEIFAFPKDGSDLGNVGPCSQIPPQGLSGSFFKARCILDAGDQADADRARCQAIVNGDGGTSSPKVYLESGMGGQKCCGDDAVGSRTDRGNIDKAAQYLCNIQDPSGGGVAQGPFFWENALEHPFKIYSFSDGSLSYDAVSNGRYWYVCDTSSGISSRTYTGFDGGRRILLREFEVLPSPGNPDDNVGTIAGGGGGGTSPIVGGGGGSGVSGSVVPIDAIVESTPLVATAQDHDGDGFRADHDGNGVGEEKNGIDDCDDSNARIYPGAQDVQNNINEDCDPGDGADGAVFLIVDRPPTSSQFDQIAKRFICYNQ